MANSVSKSQNNSIKMYIFTSIPLIFILSSVFHFAYDALGKWTYLAIVFPKSESVFEHLKLAIYPTLIVWILGYIILSKRKNIDIKNTFVKLSL